MAVKLIALDLDGTLLGPDKHVSVRTGSVLEECGKRKIEIVPATGRSHLSAPSEVLALPGVHYGIFANGAEVRDLVHGKTVYERKLNRETAVSMIRMLRDYPIFYDMYADGQGICERSLFSQLDSFPVPPEILRFYHATRQLIDDAPAFLEQGKASVEKLNLIFRDRETKAEVRTRLEAYPGCIVTSSLPWNLEVNAEGADKGQALDCLTAFLGIEREETMAFGDGENDLSMLEAAGMGIAMANGAPFLKEKADAVTASNEEDGVAQAIERWVLK